MKRKVASIFVITISSFLLISLVLLESAYAAPVAEAEAIGATSNNSPGTAEPVPSAAFTIPEPATVFTRPNSFTASITGFGGGGDVDFYRFSTLGFGSNILMLDADAPRTFDGMIALYDSSFTLIAFDEDSGFDPDNDGSNMPFVGKILIAPGTYYVAYTNFPNFPTPFFSSCSFVSDLTRPSFDTGGAIYSACTAGDATFGSSSTGGSSEYLLHISLYHGGRTLSNIGGEIIPIDTTALLLAGVQSISMWMIPVVAAGIGISVFVIKRRK